MFAFESYVSVSVPFVCVVADEVFSIWYLKLAITFISKCYSAYTIEGIYECQLQLRMTN